MNWTPKTLVFSTLKCVHDLWSNFHELIWIFLGEFKQNKTNCLELGLELIEMSALYQLQSYELYVEIYDKEIHSWKQFVQKRICLKRYDCSLSRTNCLLIEAERRLVRIQANFVSILLVIIHNSMPTTQCYLWYTFHRKIWQLICFSWEKKEK